MIATTTAPSKSQPDTQHTLWIHDGKAIGCTCMHRQKQQWVPCPHMKHYNREAVSCAICGAWTYKPDGVCGKCYGY